MLTLMTSMLFVFVLQEPQENQAQDFTKEFEALCQTFAKTESYIFNATIQEEGGNFMGRRSEEAEEGVNQPTKIEGKFQKGKPYWVKSGAYEAYRLDESTVYREGEGDWQLFDRRAMMGGFGRRGGERRRPEREEQPEPSREEMVKKYDKDGDGELSEEEEKAAREAIEKERGERGESDEGGERGERSTRGERGERGGGFSSMRALFSLSRTGLPHKTLESVIGKVKDIQREESEDKLIYSATLTPEGAEALAFGGASFGRRRGNDRGGEGPEFKNSGTVCITSTAEGRIVKIEITTTMKGAFMDQDFERSSKTNYALTDLDQVKMEVPEEVITKFML